MLKQIDIAHENQTVKEAMMQFIQVFNECHKKGAQLEVVHGYGSSGTGGKIKSALNKFIEKNKECTRVSEINSGSSKYTPLKMLPPYISIIDELVLANFNDTKNRDKLLRQVYKRYRDFTQKEVGNRIDTLMKQSKFTKNEIG